MKHIQKKIAIIIHSLGKGGEEKASANLSILLSDLGFETHLISALNYVDYEYKGQLLNLGVLKEMGFLIHPEPDKDESLLLTDLSIKLSRGSSLRIYLTKNNSTSDVHINLIFTL